MEETILIELIKTGLQSTSKVLERILEKINKNRLKKKKEGLKNKKKKDVSLKEIQLTQSEILNGKIILNIDRTSENIKEHIKEIQRWAQIIKFSDLDKKKTLNSVYIQLDTYLVPVKKHFSDSERKKTLPLEKVVFTGNEHCVILGQPGAGKTTSLKKICELIIKEENDTNHTFPILLRFRDLENEISNTPILDHIAKVIPIQFEFNGHNAIHPNSDIELARQKAIVSFLNNINPIIVLDGFDELRNSIAKEVVLKELRKLASQLTEAKILLSCRTGEFNYELEYSNTYEIAPLNNNQIEVFVKKWLVNEEKATSFLDNVKNSPFADTAIKPLSLAHLCAIYQRIGNIPDQPKTIYRKVVGLLIEEWDEQRSIIRQSAFTGFQTDQKFEFLTHLSFFLTTEYQSSTFSTDEFKEAYISICGYHSLPNENSSKLVKELESHTGLFVESGYNKFEFVHKSIQEYLAADYIVKLPSLNSIKNRFEILGTELAISISISSNPSLYYTELVLNYILYMILPDSFYNSFIARIISENPSFNNEEFTSLATLVLLSNWVNPKNKRINPINNYPTNQDKFYAFLKLSKSLNLQNQKTNFFQFYRFSEKSYKGIVELNRIKEPKLHKRLPSKIYLPTDLYSKIFN